MTPEEQLLVVLMMQRITALERKVEELDVALIKLKQIQSGSTDHPSTFNKGMTCSVTAADGQLATATTIAAVPLGYVFVEVNGKVEEVGNAVKTKAAYFSGDGGATARAFGAIVAGDGCYWNGSIAGYQLDATDVISFHYDA